MSQATPEQIVNLLPAAWSAGTGRHWRFDNPARSQCSVTALVVQDLLGGTILRTMTAGGWHFHNLTAGRRHDFTASQLTETVGYDDLPGDRADALTDTSPECYATLRERPAMVMAPPP